MEACNALCVVLDVAMKQLDCHYFSDLYVLDPINGAHCATADGRDHTIAIGDDVARFEQRGIELDTAGAAELGFGWIGGPAGDAGHSTVWGAATHAA